MLQGDKTVKIQRLGCCEERMLRKKQGVDSRDKLEHIERNHKLFVTEMIKVAK